GVSHDPDEPPPPRPVLEFTAYHQLVDGGVAENIPFLRPVKLMYEPSPAKRPDMLFVLLAARAPAVAATTPRSLHGKEVIASTSDELWESYQASLLFLPYAETRKEQLRCDWYAEALKTRAWREAVRTALGDFKLREIERNLRDTAPESLALSLAFL